MKLLPARSPLEDRVTVPPDGTAAVSRLYAEQALGITRLAYVMLGDRAAAEDVVHDAFFGLCRRWTDLTDTQKARSYLRSSVLNGCRTALRRQGRNRDVLALRPDILGPDVPGADVPLLANEDRQAVMAALRRLPHRQREALVLRYYLELPDTEIAQTMGIGESTVRSTAHRGLVALERILTKELP
jgi:RNA polymerase sigma factor (sigma-70 family)